MSDMLMDRLVGIGIVLVCAAFIMWVIKDDER